jgi:hypothetical protein
MKTPTVFNQSGARRRLIQRAWIDEFLEVLTKNFIEHKVDLIVVTPKAGQANTVFFNLTEFASEPLLYDKFSAFISKNKLRNENLIPIIFLDGNGVDMYAVQSK